MALTAAALLGAGGIGGVLDWLFGGDVRFSVVPSVAALLVACVLVSRGPRLPRPGLAGLGPLGVAFLGYAFATSPKVGNTAALFVLPALWTAFFFGTPGAVAIVICVGVANALALISIPSGSGYVDQWLDVMVAVAAGAAVVNLLARRNVRLLARLANEARTDTLTGALNAAASTNASSRSWGTRAGSKHGWPSPASTSTTSNASTTSGATTPATRS